MRELNPFEWAVRPLKRYASFSGRAPRAEYWWFNLFTFVLGILLSFLGNALGVGDSLRTVANIALLLPSLAVIVRRLHDTNRGGVWLFGLVACVAIAFSISLLAPGGDTARFTMFTITALLGLAAVLTFFVFMVLPGSEGPNDYGPDPYGSDALEEVFA